MKLFTRLSMVICCLSALAILVACGGKTKKSLNKADADLEAEDFVNFFEPLQLPYNASASLLQAAGPDSLRIDNTVFAKFMGDTVLSKLHGTEKPAIYAVGSISNPKAETYILYRTSGQQKGLYVSALNEQGKPTAHMLLMGTKGVTKQVNTVGIDSKFNITLTDEYKAPDGSTSSYHAVYAYVQPGQFLEIMNDGLKQGEEMPIINPIDTLPATRPHTGDYAANARNFISIRDGKDDKRIAIFLNMDKQPDCVAEIKGEAVWITRDSALYESKDDPCKLGLKFKGNSITITETGTCGSRRPGGCSFNASYTRKQAPKKVQPKKTTNTAKT
ncbi:MAG TPA: hypothetical protein PKD90_14530 [Phnomibacter sp.]|nr:hypothetical protein [Phnomibacter sp.]